jgi:predicted Zn-dependent protease
MWIPENSPAFSAGLLAAKGLQSPAKRLLIPQTTALSPLQQNVWNAIESLQQRQTEEAAADRLTVRWALDRMPLSVYITPSPDWLAGERDKRTQLLFTVMRQWEAASGGLIRFRLVNSQPFDPGQADIRIVWADETTLGRDFEVGHAERDVRGAMIQRVTITLIQKPKIDAHLSPVKQQQRLQATILHETGHALGLEHSEQTRDVMYYRGWQQRYLSDNDSRRLQALYPAPRLF